MKDTRKILTFAGLLGLSMSVSCAPEAATESVDLVSSNSHRRLPGESYLEAETRYKDQLKPSDLDSFLNLHSARSVAKQSQDNAYAPEWPDLTTAEEAFAMVRDKRFLTDPEVDSRQRRSSWLYPDDGCFARADLMVRNMAEAGYPNAAKLFAFGSLAVSTDNAPGGAVFWWYHVVPVISVDAEKYVFDPAVDPSGLLTVDEWLGAISTAPDTVELAWCGTWTYGPASRCLAAIDGGPERATTDQSDLLPLEVDRLESLGRSAEQELGDSPPWL